MGLIQFRARIALDTSLLAIAFSLTAGLSLLTAEPLRPGDNELNRHAIAANSEGRVLDPTLALHGKKARPLRAKEIAGARAAKNPHNASDN